MEGHEDTNGISINANELTHNGATIVDAADSTKNAVLTHGVEPADPDHKVDGVRPVFQSATIFPADPDRIVLRYDESLSPSLAPTAFEVTVNGETRNPDSVTHFPVDGVTFVFGSDFRAGDDVEISYTVPATNPIQDVAGNDAVAFPSETVTNNLAATAPDAPTNRAVTSSSSNPSTCSRTKDRINSTLVSTSSSAYSFRSMTSDRAQRANLLALPDGS